MSLSDTPRDARSIALSLPIEQQWTLHHVLLDRIEREETTPADVEPPRVEVFQAFEALDAGETRFTRAQLEAIEDLLSEYHHSTGRWEAERSTIEALLATVTEHLDGRGRALPADE
ncbi:hypothetical protein [Halomicrobium salinisoli]|uniref:DUF7853 family protein n=1 Tax=Halomicrobium salinisoli TaxID=2878391 RepID=UPI001CF04AC2|nr:hypothetical protein [Halomicrobium salinisoli]